MKSSQVNLNNIVFFDGICNLCNTFVTILMKLDRKNILYFAPLQGETAKLKKLHFTNLPIDKQSLHYLSSKGILYSQSNAVIQILHDLFFIGKVFLIFKIIPRSLRDYLYSIVAKNRYSLFGKKDHCRVPTSHEKSRFLD